MPVVVLTATTSGPCACCGVGGVTLSCRTRGGVAALCGYDEFTSPSVPPRKFKTVSFSGAGWDGTYYDNDTCAGASACAETITVAGACSFSTSPCAPGTGGSYTVARVSGSGCTTPGTYPSCDFGADPSVGDFITLSQTTKQIGTTGGCGNYAPGKSLKRTYMDVIETLTSEDTEADAIARLLAGAGGTWSAWTTVGNGSGGTCVAIFCCQANYQQRSGFTFGYHEAQFKADMAGLLPSTNYVLSLVQYRRLYASSDPWVQLVIDEYGFTTDGSGNAEVTGDVLNLEGYETYIADPIVNPA